MPNELKPCPFCGSMPTVTFDKDGKWFFIECSNQNCPILVQGMWHTSGDEAKSEWNRRAENA